MDSGSQAVVSNGVKSDKIPVSSGVPQGSVLGPILYLAYINDLPDQVNSRVRLFAAATAIYLAISSEGESIPLQNDLHILEIWDKRWDMSFNPSKCQVLHITRAKWAATWQNQQSGCAPSEDSDQPGHPLSAWRKLGSLATHWAQSEDSDQTGRMPGLIWVFAGRTVTLLVFVMSRLKCPIQTRYILHGTVLESVISAKYLGVTVSDNLSWTPTLIQSPRKQTKH